MATGAENRSILLDLADKQDKFEHEYSSELVTRIGLFLVFAGFVSGVALELLKIVREAVAPTGIGHILTVTFLGLSGLSLFAAMLLLLHAAFLPGYSAPGTVSEYRAKYKELLSYHQGDEDQAQQDLKEWILDATAEAVDQNIVRNGERASAIKRAQMLLLASIICLFLTLVFFALFYLRTGGKASREPSRTAATVTVPGGPSNAESKRNDQAKRTEGTTKAGPAAK